MRPNQREVLNAIEQNWNSFNYIFLEASTGFGKSAVAYAVAKWLLAEHGKFTHFLVSDIYLQNQYLRDFKDMASIKGRRNFECSVSKQNVSYLYDDFKVEHPTCDDAPCTIDPKYRCAYKPSRVKKNDEYSDPDEEDMEPFDDYGIKLLWNKSVEPYCSYWLQKDKAIHNPLTIHNYPFFMNEMLFSKYFARRTLGIFDEAHTIESTLMSFIEMNINEKTLNRISSSIGTKMVYVPNYNDIGEWSEWLTDVSSEMEKRIEKMGTTQQIASQGADAREIRNRLLAENTLEKINILRDNMAGTPDNWVFHVYEDNVLFRPVKVSEFAKDALLGHTDKHILISATILDPDKLKSYLGITEDVRFLRVHNSNFPVQNRPLYVKSQGKATSATMDEYLPRMLNYIDNVLLPRLIKDKGVIHSHTNDIARYILFNSKYRDIMVSNVDNLNEKRDHVFQRFFDAPTPQVMVTPSMRLGVDLRDDLARWQIITKVPYPYLGDPQIKRRTEIDAGWYDYQTITSIIQTYGRVCRSETDYGETYVLDGKFDDIFFRNINYFPAWFKEAVRR
jgi:ATP-dependent DNA helicase DinG